MHGDWISDALRWIWKEFGVDFTRFYWFWLGFCWGVQGLGVLFYAVLGFVMGWIGT